MIIENGKGITTTTSHGEITFEIHLPKIVGSVVFETDEGLMLERFSRVNHLVALQNSRNGAGTGHLRLPQIQQPLFQFTTAPGRMFAPHTEHRVFDFRGRLPW